MPSGLDRAADLSGRERPALVGQLDRAAAEREQARVHVPQQPWQLGSLHMIARDVGGDDLCGERHQPVLLHDVRRHLHVSRQL
jgi:hypothetical protein